jgi:hypothetical protein
MSSLVAVQVYPICKFTVDACNSLGWDFVCSIALTLCTVRGLPCSRSCLTLIMASFAEPAFKL